MQFGSSGVGSGSHFSCAKLNAALGIEPTHVPYRGSALAMQDVIGGRIDYFCALGAAAMGPLEATSLVAVQNKPPRYSLEAMNSTMRVSACRRWTVLPTSPLSMPLKRML